MDAVHWWAASGLVSFVGAAWLLVRAWEHDRDATAKLTRRTEQMELLREAIALMQYGARDEAADVIEHAIEIGETK